MNVMSGERTRVDFNAPSSLVERADAVADVLGVSRTQLLVDALRDELGDIASDDEFRSRIERAYYDGDVDFDVVESILGTEDAIRLNLLKSSIDREPPEPELEDGLPGDREFYEGDPPEWLPRDDETTSNA